VIARLVALRAVALALAGLVGCGSEADGSRASLEDQVYDFETGSQVSLASLTLEGRPTLLWFWAPWCEICNAEASTVKKLARTAKERLRVVGVGGGRDSVKAGRDFLERHGLEAMSVVYDEPGRVWDGFGIGPQPAAVLLDRDAQELRRWQGPFDPREVERLARQ